MSDKTMTKADLERECERLREKLKHAEQEKAEAFDLVAKIRDRLETNSETLASWIEVFEMAQDEGGVYRFTTAPGDLWGKYDELLDAYNKLLADWNKLVPRYNAAIAPRDRGRPLQASDAQIERVQALRKKGVSLRAIAKETALSFSTVRTIVSRAEGTDAPTQKRKGLVRREADRLRAAAYRARKRTAGTLPKADHRGDQGERRAHPGGQGRSRPQQVVARLVEQVRAQTAFQAVESSLKAARARSPPLA
jgi:hypothetical protein